MRYQTLSTIGNVPDHVEPPDAALNRPLRGSNGSILQKLRAGEPLLDGSEWMLPELIATSRGLLGVPSVTLLTYIDARPDSPGIGAAVLEIRELSGAIIQRRSYPIETGPSDVAGARK